MENEMRALRRQESMAAQGFVHAVGEVIRGDGEGCVVRTATAGLLECRRAASCLLQPEIGDRVLVSGPDANETFVIAVLERCTPGMQRLTLTGDTTISVQAGTLSLQGQQGIALASPQTISLSGQQLTATAATGTFVVGASQWVGRSLDATVSRLKLLGESLESLVDRVVQHSRISVRRIDEMERVESRQIDYHAQEMLSLRGEATMIGGKELIKADGKQIHLG
jgi:hypothetical protein